MDIKLKDKNNKDKWYTIPEPRMESIFDLR